MTIGANPLYQYRAPRGIRHPHVDGDHFSTRREDVINDTGVLNIYPGMFRYTPNPSLEVELAVIEDAPDPRVQANVIHMLMREHFQECRSDEWEVLDEVVAKVWKPAAGRLTFMGAVSNCLVLVFRTAEEAERVKKLNMSNGAEISKSPEDVEAEMNDKLGPLGASVRVDLSDDDGTDRADAPRVRKRRQA
jgi:hypothetical protein